MALTGAASPVLGLDPGSGRQLAASLPVAAGQLASAGDSLWLASQTGYSPPGPVTVTAYQLDPSTLVIRQFEVLPAPKGSLAQAPIAGSSDGRVWVGDGGMLGRLDGTAAGGLVTSVTAGGPVFSLTLDGQGRLYDSLRPVSGPAVVEQRDATTGRLQATRPIPQATSGIDLGASSTGVWASYRSGTGASSVLLAANSLAPQALPDASLFSGPGDTTATVSGGVLWVSGSQHLICADPGTGAIRATESRPGVGPVSGPVALGRLLYVAALPASSREPAASISVVSPPAACWGP